MTPEPQTIVISAGVAARYAPPRHVLAFIEEMKLGPSVHSVVKTVTHNAQKIPELDRNFKILNLLDSVALLRPHTAF